MWSFSWKLVEEWQISGDTRHVFQNAVRSNPTGQIRERKPLGGKTQHREWVIYGWKNERGFRT